uniref:chain-length determining protein n=1 Tax=Sphingomonas sp. H160509 TaxID=2955313 RepID=UPI003158ACC1
MNGIYDEVRIALHAIWTRRWLALAVAWGVCVLGWLVVSQIPSRYDSTARVFVQMQTILPSGMDGVPQVAPMTVDTIRTTLISAVNLEKVVRGTDLANTVSSDRDVADRVAALAPNIKIVSQQDNLFQITTSAATPKLARQITQKLIDLFVEQNLAGDRSKTTQSLTFLDQQLASRQKQLADAEAKRADFQNRYLGALPGTGSVSDRISAARSQMSQVDGDLAAAQSSLAAVQGQMAGTPATVAGTGGRRWRGRAGARTAPGDPGSARRRSRARLYREPPRRDRAEEPARIGHRGRAQRAAVRRQCRGQRAEPALRVAPVDGRGSHRHRRLAADAAEPVAGRPRPAQFEAVGRSGSRRRTGLDRSRLSGAEGPVRRAAQTARTDRDRRPGAVAERSRKVQRDRSADDAEQAERAEQIAATHGGF